MGTYVLIVLIVGLAVAGLITVGVLVSLHAGAHRPAHRRANVNEQRLQRALEIAKAHHGRV